MLYLTQIARRFITELRKQDKKWIMFFWNYPGVMSLERIDIFREQKSVMFGDKKSLLAFPWFEWHIFQSCLLSLTNFMLTDLANVPVINWWPLHSKSDLHYLLHENGAGPYKYFAFSIWHDVMHGSRGSRRDTKGRRGFSSWFRPALPSRSFPVWGLSTARSCTMQQPTAPRSQRFLFAPPQMTSQ